MSAYICNPEHIAALAAFAVKHECIISAWRAGGNSRLEQARLTAGKMMAENVRSVATRYPQDVSGQRPGPCMEDAALIQRAAELAEHYVFNPPKLTPVAILKMVHGYDYQSCETEDWRDTLAYRQAQCITGQAIRLLHGYEAAPWSFEDAATWPREGAV